MTQKIGLLDDSLSLQYDTKSICGLQEWKITSFDPVTASNYQLTLQELGYTAEKDMVLTVFISDYIDNLSIDLEFTVTIYDLIAPAFESEAYFYTVGSEQFDLKLG